MNGQVTLYVIGSLLAGGAWIGIGLGIRRIFERTTGRRR